MRSMTFQIDDQSTGSAVPAVIVTITENGDGTVSFTLTVVGDYTGDLRGFFFDLADESHIGELNLTSASAGLSEFQQVNDTVANLGNGSNMQGLLGSDGGYDAGIEIGTAGIGSDDYQSFTFTLSSEAGALTLDDFSSVDFGVRLTSVGEIDGSRTDSAKLLEHTSSAIDANDDGAALTEEIATEVIGDLLANDSNEDTTRSVTAVTHVASGAGGVVADIEGIDIEGTYGRLHVNADGTYTYALRNDSAAVQALAQGQPVEDRFSYTATSSDEATSSSTDSADLVITITGTNDAPDITGGTATGLVFEDGAARMARGQLTAFDVDHGAIVSWTTQNDPVLGAPRFGLASVDAGGWTYTLDNTRLATQQLAQGQVAMDSFVVRASDQHGAFDTQLVTVTVRGTGDRPNLPPTPLTLFASEDGAQVFGATSAFDFDLTDVHHWSLNHGSSFGYFSPYEFRAESFSITKNGNPLFDDDFDTGTAPPSAPNFLPLPGTPANYSVNMFGSFEEAGDKLVMKGANATAFRGTGNNALIVGNEAILQTNASTLPADQERGLRKHHNFEVTGVFDLIEPQLVRQGYGLTMTDAVNQIADDLLSLVVRRDATDGRVYVRFNNNSAVLDTSELVGEAVLAPELFTAGTTQIRLKLSHVAGSGDMSASYEILGTGIEVALGQAGVFGSDTPDFAGDDENWIRAGLFANATDTNEDVQTLVSNYGTLSVGNPGPTNVGQLTYTPNGIGVQALAQNQSVVDSFFVRVVDPFGMSSSQRVNVIVNGTNDPLMITSGPQSGVVVEDADATPSPADSLIAAGTISFSDVDLRDGHRAAFAPAPTNTTALGTFALGPVDEAFDAADGSVGWIYTLDNAAAQFLDGGQTVTETYFVTLTDDFGATATQTVTVSVQGTAEGGNRPPVANSDSNFGIVIEAGVNFMGLPILGNPTATGNVLANDTDPDGDALHLTSVNGVPVPQDGLVSLRLAFGSIQINSFGDWTYELDNSDPDTNALGPFAPAPTLPPFEQINYTVSDGQGGTGSAALTLSITGTNDLPVAIPDSNSVIEDVSLVATGNVLTDGVDDYDPEGNFVSVIAPPMAIQGRYGSLTISPNGDYRYEANASRVNFLAEGEVVHEIFEGAYAVSEGFAFTNATRLDIAITGTAEAPSGANGAVFEDGMRKVTGNLELSPNPTWSIVGEGPMTPWAEYRFRLDNLSIVRSIDPGPAPFFNDNFGNGVPPPAGASGLGYTTVGTFTETGGRASMEGGRAALVAPGVVGHSALLNTNTGDSDNLGLKRALGFRVDAQFDLVLPDQAFQGYGIRLTDAGLGAGDDVVQIAVQREQSGSFAVVLSEIDLAGGSLNPLESIALTPASSDNRIRLHLEHTANTDTVRASFELISGDVVRESRPFDAIGQIFLGENWTRPEVVSFSPVQHQQNGLYGTLSAGADSKWTYSLNNTLASVQALGQGERATDTFTVQAPGASESQTIKVDVVGTNDFPNPIVGFNSFYSGGPIINGVSAINGVYGIEDGAQQTASGFAFFSDDHGRPVQWSVTAPGSPSAYRSDYAVRIDDLRITRDTDANFFADNFNDGTVLSASSVPTYLTPTGVFGESGGRAVINGALAATIGGVGTSDLLAAHIAVPDTNINPDSPGRGLKIQHDFIVETRFDYDHLLTLRAGQGFGVALSDRAVGEVPLDQLGDDTVGLLVTRNAAGDYFVQFDERDSVSDSITVIGTIGLDAVPATGRQIVLRLEHDAADRGRIQASFDVFDGATSQLPATALVQHGAFGADPLRADRIFGQETPDNPYDDEVWTRAQIIAAGRDAAGTTAQGTFGTLSVAQDGDWLYTLNNTAAQGLTQGQIFNDSFNLRATDSYGASTSRQINVGVIGTNDPPAAPIAPAPGTNGNDVRVGTNGDDTFIGGPGSDLLIGLAGRDTFKFTSINDGRDTISDFTPGVAGDVLDIKDVLQGYVPPPPPPPGFPPVPTVPFNFVRLGTFFAADGPGTVVSVNADGSGEDFVELATLRGVGGLLLEDLIANGNLVLA